MGNFITALISLIMSGDMILNSTNMGVGGIFPLNFEGGILIGFGYMWLGLICLSNYGTLGLKQIMITLIPLGIHWGLIISGCFNILITSGTQSLLGVTLYLIFEITLSYYLWENLVIHFEKFYPNQNNQNEKESNPITP